MKPTVLKNKTEPAEAIASGAGSGVCELTNQSRLGNQEGLKQSISDWGAALDSNPNPNPTYWSM